MSDTPETNAFFDHAISTKSKYPAYCAPFEGFCQKLEQDRDEARSELENMKETKRELMQMVYGRNWVEQDLLKDRDEARAVAGELADIVSKYLSFLLAVTPSKTNETHEKETMRVIDALKRWKKL